MEEKLKERVRNFLYLIIFVFILFLLLRILSIKEKPLKLKKTFYLMGGIPLHLTVFDVSRTKFETLCEKLKVELENLENIASSFKKRSQVFVFNSSPAKKWIKIDKRIFNIIKKSVEISKQTNGLFDITVKPLFFYWKNLEKNKKIPDQKEIQKLLSRIGYTLLKLNPQKSEVLKLKDGVMIDLGGIAKGFFLDSCKQFLRNNGVKKAICEIGGDLVVFNVKDNKLFKVGIRSPFDESKLFGILKLKNRFVATSGCYERYFMVNNKKYCHIFNPKTGFPVNNDLKSATIVANSGVEADAFATAVFLMGFEKGKLFIQKNRKIEGILINENGKFFVSEELRKNFEKLF